MVPLAKTQDRECVGTGVGSEGRVGVAERCRCRGGAGGVDVDGPPRWGIRRVTGAVLDDGGLGTGIACLP